MSEVTRIEFDDPDDPESQCNESAIRIRIAPEGTALFLRCARHMGREDMNELGSLLRFAYEQGKRIGYEKAIRERHDRA